jgi:DNA-binding YbaB/EbfC family protein
MGPFGALFGGLQQRMEAAKAKAAAVRFEASAGGGLVTAVATGDAQIERLTIKPEALQDPELLEDLIRAAVNEALRGAQKEGAGALAEIAAGLPIPPGLLGM